MVEIGAALDALTRPWPAWVDAEVEDDADDDDDDDADVEDEDQASDDEDHSEEGAQAPDEADAPAGEAADGIDQSAGPAAEDDASAEAADVAAAAEEASSPPTGRISQSEMASHTGETNVEDPAESTVVKPPPIAVFLERPGEEPVRVQVDRFVIGRGPQCDLIIDSPRVSREHAALIRVGVRFMLEDLKSSNGTWFQGAKITKRELESGDVVTLGNEHITFVLRGE